MGTKESRQGRPAKVKLPVEIWVLVGASFLIALGYGLVAPAIPSYATSFDVGITAASVVISAFAAMRLAFAPVSGRLVTKFGERPIYLCGISIVGVGSLACAFAQEYWQLLLFRSLSGIGSTMFTVSAIGLLIRLSPPELRGRTSGLWGSSFLLGSVAGPIAGTGLVAISLRAPFIGYGIGLLLTTGLVWWRLRHSALAARAEHDDAEVMTFRAALRHPTYRAALGANFSNGWVVLGVRTSLVPLFVATVLVKDAKFAGIALAAFAAGNAAVLLVSGRFSDRYGRKPLASTGLAMLAVATGLLGLVTQPVLFLVVSLLAGAAAGTANPGQNAAVADILGTRARGGSVLAGFQMTADVGAVLGPLVAGVLAERGSFPLAFGGTAVVAALAFVLWLFATETAPAKVRATNVARPARSGEPE